MRCAQCVCGVCLYTHTVNIFFASTSLSLFSLLFFFLSFARSFVRSLDRSLVRSFIFVWHVLLLLIYWICYKLNIHFFVGAVGVVAAYAKHMCDYCFILVCKLTKYRILTHITHAHQFFANEFFRCRVCVLFYWHGILEWICFCLTKIHDIIPSTLFTHYMRVVCVRVCVFRCGSVGD